MGGYNASNPGPAVEISAPESGTIYRGFTCPVATTIEFVSNGNTLGPVALPVGFQCGVQIDSITSITGTIWAYTREPFSGGDF